jgi:hypothetical protein
MIGHAHFPFDESPWIPHFHDADEANQRSLISQASSADEQGHDAFARHIMSSQPGDNPFESYGGPFNDGQRGQQFTPDMPNHLYSQYFGNYRAPGASLDSPGPFTDPRKMGPSGGAGPAVTGPDYLQRLYQQGGTGGVMPFGGARQ